MNGNKVLAASIAVFTGACLFLTGWIIHKSGVTQGATDDGQWALGWAAIAVHVSLAICGLAMFSSRKWCVSFGLGVIMLGAAVTSAWMITSFLATEVISVTKAREMRERRENARVAAALDLAKDELKWSRGTWREVDGRRERKDMADSRTKLITEIGKSETTAKVEGAPLQAGLVAQWVAKKLNWDETALQASPYLLIALMLLLIEVILWPTASYFWNKPAEAATISDSPEAGKPSVSSTPKGGSGESGETLKTPAAPKDKQPATVAAKQAEIVPLRKAEPSVPGSPPSKPQTVSEYLREHAGITYTSQAALAKASGFSPATVSRELTRLDNGRGKVKRSKHKRGAKAVTYERNAAAFG
jgi:hypothetical protein